MPLHFDRPSSKEQLEAGNMDELPADEAQGEPGELMGKFVHACYHEK